MFKFDGTFREFSKHIVNNLKDGEMGSFELIGEDGGKFLIYCEQLRLYIEATDQDLVEFQSFKEFIEAKDSNKNH